MSKQAIFGGGCFWGMEELLHGVPGVITTTVGYTGGTNEHPTYENHPGHAEAVLIEYDPSRVTYKQLLDFFFRLHDPTTLNRQGNDVGIAYRSVIFYQTEEEKREGEPFSAFYPAEEYHQDYLQKNPGGYTCHAIRFGSYLSQARLGGIFLTEC